MLLLSFLPEMFFILHVPDDSCTKASDGDADDGRPVSKSSFNVSAEIVQSAVKIKAKRKTILLIL